MIWLVSPEITQNRACMVTNLLVVFCAVCGVHKFVATRTFEATFVKFLAQRNPLLGEVDRLSTPGAQRTAT